MDVERALAPFEESSQPHKDFGLIPIPKRLRCSATHPFYFGLWTRIVFASGCAFIVANLYYCQPLLIQMASDFDTTFEEASLIPTLYQAGYFIGLFFISPLGDLIRRRQLILALVLITTCLSVGLVLSTSLLVFQTFAFLIGVFNVTPQILIPFAADLALPGQRGAAVSVLQTGLMLGILLARVVAGVVANFFHWRMVYYVSIGVQVIVLCGAYLFTPDYSRKNPDLTYLTIFYTMIKYAVTEPRLVQAVLINVASIACWSSFWLTLTFLLADPPYNYSTLYIGLFGLIGVIGVLGGPIFGHFVSRYGPWLSLFVATCCLLVFQTIETAAAGIHIAVVVVFCVGLNTLRQSQTVFLQTIVFGISEDARSRLNAIFTLSLSTGQAIGTSAGSQIFLTYGWRAASALSIGFYVWQLFVLLFRGPNCKPHIWFGYEGGFTYQVKQKQNGTTTPPT
ncbi:major facilitator superfamily domain-containing protein [Chiua virens]|nr:major facilitator superfamily domain-containing protein [Chiua virens]